MIHIFALGSPNKTKYKIQKTEEKRKNKREQGDKEQRGPRYSYRDRLRSTGSALGC